MKISKNYLQKPKRDPHLHSPSHVLADELSSKLGDPKHFGFYLKTALTIDHNVLRKIMGDVLEKANKNPGALFAYLVKKYNREKDVNHGYSVWLLPEPEIREKLNRTIQSLAASYKSIPFPAHVSLLGDLPTSQPPEPLNSLSELKEFSCNIGPVEMEEIYFKSFYLPITKNKELAKARRLAKKAFNPDSKHKFNPHLSILYGNFKPEQKPEMIRSLTISYPQTIKFTEIALVNTEGRANEWQIIKSIRLQPQE